MKQILLICALIVGTFLSSQATTSLSQGSLSGLPNQAGNPSALSNINKIVEYGSNIYCITTDKGIYTISKTGLTGSGSWTSFNVGLPQYTTSPVSYQITDMDICGTYLYVICLTSSAQPQVWCYNLSGGSTFVNVSPSSALASGGGVTYMIQPAGGYVYIAGSSNGDLRYAASNSSTWTSLTVNPGGYTPGFIHSMVLIYLSGGAFNLQWCCDNGLFILNLNSSGSPAFNQGYVPALGNINQMACINSSGVFQYGYISEYSSGLHPWPSTLERLITGSATVYSVSIPSLSGVWISSLCTWNNVPHFGVQAFSGNIADVLYVGNSNASTFTLSSSCTSISPLNPTPGVICMYGGDATTLLVSVWANGLWYSTNTSCKTDGISDLGEGESIRIYPQPATSELTVNYVFENSNPSIAVYDISGRVQNVPVTMVQTGEARLDVSGLSKGVYLLELNNGARITKRIVID